MRTQSNIRRLFALLFIVVFLTPLLLRSYHFITVHHDKHNPSQSIQFSTHKEEFCAYHQDLFQEYEVNAKPYKVSIVTLIPNTSQTPLSNFYHNILFEKKGRSPPFVLVLKKTI